jgi:hypothetical protein
MTVMTSREFVNDIAKAQEATASGPVFVTDHGQTTHVLMTLAQFEKLASGQSPLDAVEVNKPKTLAEIFATDDPMVAEFEFPQFRNDMPRIPDLS